MSRKRRSFSSEFKFKAVIEVLKGDKPLTEIATELEIHPNMLRQWKTEFMEHGEQVFDHDVDAKLKEQIAQERRQNTEYAKKVGQLTMQVDWLKKKSEEQFGPNYEDLFTPKPFKD